jgi:superfamily II DNA or RNA helicase
MKFNTDGLLGPQGEHAIKLADSIFFNGVAADLSETGIGKTYCAAKVAQHFQGPIVVVGPLQILRKWKEILNGFGKDAVVYIGFEKLCRGNTPWLTYKKSAPKPADVIGTVKKKRKFHPDETQLKYFNAQIHFPPGALVIIDEGHRCKGVNSLNAGFMAGLKRQGYKVLMLSATAATCPLDMRAFGYLTNLIETFSMKDYKKFCMDAGATETGHYGALQFDLNGDVAQRKMREIHHYLFNVSKIASRLTREDMGALFPENEVISESYDMGDNSDRIQHAYDIMEREIAKLSEQTANYAAHVFAKIMEARRRIEMLKVPTLVEMTEDLYDESKSVVIFVNFTETINAIESRLNHMRKFRNKDLIGIINGERTINQRNRDIDAFQADTKRILIVNIACAESIGLHDLNGRFPRASLVNPSFSAIKVLQSLGRIHRQGGLTKCYQRFVFADRTYENKICDRLSARLDNISFLNDGDLTGGINWFRMAEGRDL